MPAWVFFILFALGSSHSDGVACSPSQLEACNETQVEELELGEVGLLQVRSSLAEGLGTISVSPSVVSTSGGEVLVALHGNMPQARALHCHLHTAPNGWDVGAHHRTHQGQRVGHRTVRCRLPAVPAEGPVLLQVSSAGELQSSAVLLRYEARLSASFGQTPYFASDEGELLVRTNIAQSSSLTVHVTSPAGDALLEAPVEPKAHSTFKVSFAALNKSFNELMNVKLVENRSIVLEQTQARLVRVAERRRGSAAVDHKRRGLLVDGRPFLSIAWFDMYLFYSPEATIDSLRAMAQRGANSVMIYNLVGNGAPPTFPDRGIDPVPMNTTLAVLDAAATLGIKVHVYLVDIVKPLADSRSSDWAPLQSVVKALREHPAVLAWYVADDSAGARLPQVYRVIKELDPYHLVSVALIKGEQLRDARYLQGADVIMMEAYNPSADGPFNAMKAYSSWPAEFMPAITCGRAWTRSEDNGVVSRKVFRSHLYHALIGGATGEMWFAYRNAQGWNQPGIPLEDAASEVAGELLDLVPSLLSSGPYDNATALEPVTVLAHRAGGGVDTTAVKAKALREESGCVTLLLASSLNEPVQATVQFAHGTPGVFDDSTRFAEAEAPYEGGATPRRVTVWDGTLVDMLPSLGTQVFRLSGTGNCADVGLPPSRDDHPPGPNLVQNPSFELSRAYASSPDSWDCSLSPSPVGSTDSSCFTDSSIRVHGRRSGRFTTGRNPELLRIRPGLDIKGAKRHFEGSVWAQADSVMALLVMHASWNPAWMPFDRVAHNETESARLTLTNEWQQLRFQVDLEEGDQLYFKVTHPGVLWLDHADLRPSTVARQADWGWNFWGA